LRSGFANVDHVPEYHPLNLGLSHGSPAAGAD
jgi:hypothetical protein